MKLNLIRFFLWYVVYNSPICRIYFSYHFLSCYGARSYSDDNLFYINDLHAVYYPAKRLENIQLSSRVKIKYQFLWIRKLHRFRILFHICSDKSVLFTDKERKRNGIPRKPLKANLGYYLIYLTKKSEQYPLAP